MFWKTSKFFSRCFLHDLVGPAYECQKQWQPATERFFVYAQHLHVADECFWKKFLCYKMMGAPTVSLYIEPEPAGMSQRKLDLNNTFSLHILMKRLPHYFHWNSYSYVRRRCYEWRRDATELCARVRIKPKILWKVGLCKFFVLQFFPFFFLCETCWSREIAAIGEHTTSFGIYTAVP